MKKIITVLVLILIFSHGLYADAAGDIMKAVYDNFGKISSIDSKYTIQTQQFRNGTKEKEITKEYNISHGVTLTAGAMVSVPYPDCLFNIEAYFKNYIITIKQKDERIKAGYEEVIAVPQGQTTQYPQVRLFIKGTKVKDIKFYNTLGKKYYTVKVKKYEKINGADFSTIIVEKMISEKTTLENTISYSFPK